MSALLQSMNFAISINNLFLSSVFFYNFKIMHDSKMRWFTQT